MRIPAIAVLIALAAAPALAARPDAGGFALTPAEPAARGVILVVNSAEACATAAVADEAALAAQAGRALGVVAAHGACGAARDMMRAAPDLAFTNSAAALGDDAEPNAFLARNRADGLYVWNLDAFARLSFAQPRHVLGVFEGESAGRMIEAAVARLSQSGAGYFLLVQADALDDAALRALDAARLAGAEVTGPARIVDAAFAPRD